MNDSIAQSDSATTVAENYQTKESNAVKRFAYVGTGSRVRTFLDPVAKKYSNECEIVALCDTSLVRAGFHQQRLQDLFGYDKVPVYPASDFMQMLEEVRPDTVVVCTIDREHDYYIKESLKAGCDVITEKPMTIDDTKCQSVLDAVDETGGSVQVAFNYRWSPAATKVKELLASGVIGEVHQINMEYLLNTSHGADYFRRWHSNKADSGGLLIHKSTHHFDLVNWWIDGIPESVFAKGGLSFYGRENALKRGDTQYTEYSRYHGNVKFEDPYAYVYSDQNDDEIYERHLYLEAEEESGYKRDLNVFREGIDIEDTMNVMVSYRHGPLLNYTLNAFSPHEGYRVAFVGDKGRIEFNEKHGSHILEADGRKRHVNEHAHGEGHTLRVLPHFKEPYEVEIEAAEGGHGGADPLLQEQLFSKDAPIDPYGRHAQHEQGAASILVGIAANQSMVSNQEVKLLDLVNLRPAAKHLSELK